ncbi:uncharacterized protein LOC129584738 isoform X2 [Paramacrobiotus metropolitanus]|uniref:uncharacterized protein LOC129584738 isoform X2 n=1 Tax=Paramacrobiotus metropolitanus TaxID=2943436 RepID=UPI00244606D1|nr:uncharacterized protein LOC129584738 isoform X2 [Paramacrobiotus metropolitanus]
MDNQNLLPSVFGCWNSRQCARNRDLIRWNRLAVYLGSRVWGSSEAGSTDLYGGFYQATAGVWLYLESVLFFSSQWILLAFCIDRFLAIELPVQHYTRKRRRSFRLLGIICVASAVNALYIPVVYYWIFSNSNLQAGQRVPEFPIAFRQWRHVEMWWEVVDRLFAYCSIATFNYMIIARIRKAANPTDAAGAPRKSSHPNIKNHSGHRTLFRTTSRTGATKILIFSSFFFLVTQSLDFVMSLLVAFSQAPICLFHITNSFLHVYDPFRNLLVNMNFAMGFVFYLCFGTNCRVRLRNSLCIPPRTTRLTSLS